MGKVVKLEPKAAGKAEAKRRARSLAARGVGRPASVDRRNRPRPDKTALVLGGGGFTGGGIETCLREVLSEPGRTDDFRQLESELYITATDLDTCERVVFGVEGSDAVPISTAVRASGALPMVYAPVRVEERELIDGG